MEGGPDPAVAASAILVRAPAVLTPERSKAAPLDHLAKLIGAPAGVMTLPGQHEARPADAPTPPEYDMSRSSDEQLETLETLMRVAAPDAPNAAGVV